MIFCVRFHLLYKPLFIGEFIGLLTSLERTVLGSSSSGASANPLLHGGQGRHG